MTKNIARKVLSAGFILSTAVMPILGSASPAEAATRHCKEVTLQVINNLGEEIKIMDIDYYDVDAWGDWRSEPISNDEVADGETWEKTRRLEKVNRQETRIRVEYKLRDSDGYWEREEHYASSDMSVCSRGSTYTVTVE